MSRTCPRSILGLQLPTCLRQLISTDKWRQPDSLDQFRELTQFKYVKHLRFCQPEAIEVQSAAFRLIVGEQYEDVYGVRSPSPTTPVVELPYVDPNKALMIILNLDEETIFLDYRHGDIPTVLSTIWDDKGPIRYRQIASCFDDFARAIGLIDPTCSL